MDSKKETIEEIREIAPEYEAGLEAAHMIPGHHAHDTAGHVYPSHTHDGHGTHAEEEDSLSNAPHRHVLEDGTVIEHTHSHEHAHTHQNTKAVLNRLSRAIGHLESIKRMVEDGRDCSEVLVQLAAVKSAVNNTGKVILHDHIEHCMVDAVRSGDMQEIEELQKAIDMFIK